MNRYSGLKDVFDKMSRDTRQQTETFERVLAMTDSVTFDQDSHGHSAYVDPEGRIGRGKTREEALVALVDDLYDDWATALVERDKAKRALSDTQTERAKLLAFFDKHALGPLAAPSCLVCGKALDFGPPAIQHAELPGIVVCHPCRDGVTYAEQCYSLLRRVDQFLTNGIELGYIRMPDADCPDPAKELPGLVKAALAKNPVGGAPHWFNANHVCTVCGISAEAAKGVACEPRVTTLSASNSGNN